MKILKTLVIVAAADILALFINMTLAGSSGTIIRLISAVCATGILICILGNFAMKTAKQDEKDARISGTERSKAMPWLMGAVSSVPAIISWLVLRFSHIDFYRYFKLINGYFLQIYNLINPDASSSALTSQQMLVMLPLALLPMIVFITGYFIGTKSDKNA